MRTRCAMRRHPAPLTNGTRRVVSAERPESEIYSIGAVLLTRIKTGVCHGRVASNDLRFLLTIPPCYVQTNLSVSGFFSHL